MGQLDMYHTLMNNLYFRVVSQGYNNLDKRWNHKGTCDCFNRLYIVLDGEGELCHKGKTIQLRKGNAYLLPQYETYDLVCHHSLTKIWVSFNLGIIPGHDFFENLQETVIQQVEVAILEDLSSRLVSKDMRELLWCQGLFYQLISNSLMAGEPIYNQDIQIAKQYRHIFDYVQNHLSFDLTSQIIARDLGLSESALARQFKKDTGLTIKDYIQRQLVNELSHQLITTRDTVAEIAHAFNFKDPFYMSRFFKKHMGISPVFYRQRYQS